MRKISGLLVVALAACGGSQDTGTTEQVTETPPGDGDDMPPPGDDGTPKPEQEKQAPPPVAKKLTLEERIAFHDGCFADFLKESPTFMDRCYTDSSTEEFVDGGEPAAKGKAAIMASTKPFWDAFTLEGEGVLNLGNGDNVISIGMVGGTNDGSLMGMPATNKKFGILIAEVQNLDDQGRHGDVRLYIDMASMMAQLGAAPKGQPFRTALARTGNPVTTVIATDSDTENGNVELVKGGMELFNKHEAKALGAKYAADALFSEQAMPMDVKGSKGVTGMLGEMFKAFPDAREEIGVIWAAGDYVVAETTFSGTNNGTSKLMGLPKATKKAVKIHGAHVFKIEGGKVKQHWIFPNGMAFAMQLGLIPPPAAPPAHK